MKSGLAKALLTASIMGGMNAAMDLQTLRPDANYPKTISAKERKRRKRIANIQKQSRKANRS